MDGLNQLLGQQRSRLVGESQRGGVGNLPELALDGCVELGMVVAVKIGPNGSVGVQVLSALHIAQHRPLARRDYDWLTRQPITHLGEGMPEIAMIQFSELMQGSG